MNITNFFLAAGTTGIALDAANFNDRYTNGNGSNQTYANADLQLQLGSASNVAFSNSVVFNARVWNGTIEYVEGAGPSPSAVPEPTSLLSCGIWCRGRYGCRPPPPGEVGSICGITPRAECLNQ